MPKEKKTEEIKNDEVKPIAEKSAGDGVSSTAPASDDKKVKLVFPKQGFFFAYGRRKTATSRARLYPPTAEIVVGNQKLAKGDIVVNDILIEKYFPDPYAKAAYTEIFRTTNTVGRFITTVKVEGSGKSGQLGAVILAIARALTLADPKSRAIFRKKRFLTRDPRSKERKKPGLMGARKQKSSPKR